MFPKKEKSDKMEFANVMIKMPAQLVLQELLVKLVQMVNLASLVNQVTKVNQEYHQDTDAQRLLHAEFAHPDQKAPTAQQELPDHLDPKVFQAKKVPQAKMEFPVQLDLQVVLERPATMAKMDLKDHQAVMAKLEAKVNQEAKAPQADQDHKDQRAMLAPMAKTETLDQPDHQVQKANRVNHPSKVLQAAQANLASPAKMLNIALVHVDPKWRLHRKPKKSLKFFGKMFKLYHKSSLYFLHFSLNVERKIVSTN